MPEPIMMTAQEAERLRVELERLKTEERRRVRGDLARARAYGDFHENAEFEQAKREQAAIEGRIAEMERIVGRVQIAEAGDVGVVAVGALVVACDSQSLEEHTFSLQASGAACPPGTVMVTPESPIGRGLLGKRPGDSVEVDIPAGKRTYRIISVSFTEGS